jgi:ribosomal protein S18 acetylase RimI-like enzyme
MAEPDLRAGSYVGMESGYHVRHAQVEDVTRLAVLATQVWLDTYASQGVSSVIAEYVLAELAPKAFAAKLGNPAITILVAERDAHLLGLAVVQSGAACAHAPVATVELATLYVHAHCKGQGIGSRLLQEARAQAASHAGSGLWLTVNARNAAATDFYRYHHFQRVGTASFILGGVAHENLVMLG